MTEPEVGKTYDGLGKTPKRVIRINREKGLVVSQSVLSDGSLRGTYYETLTYFRNHASLTGDDNGTSS